MTAKFSTLFFTAIGIATSHLFLTPNITVAQSTTKANPVAITASIETESVSASADDDAADDATLWYNQDDPASSIVLGTDKKKGVILYDLAGKRIRSYDVGRINNIDIRQSVFGSVDLVGASNRSTTAIDFWFVQGDSKTLAPAGSIKSKLPDIYGFCLATQPNADTVYALANSKTGKVEQWKLSLIDNKISGRLVRELQLPSQVEGMVADDQLGRLYVGVEEAGIYRFELPASGPTSGVMIKNSSDSNGQIAYDIEGLTIFQKPNGGGYLIASSQGNHSYAVFERSGDNTYLGSFQIEDGKVDGPQDTDGIVAVNRPLGKQFPHGIFICQDGENFDGQNKMPQNFKYVRWDVIAKKLNLD